MGLIEKGRNRLMLRLNKIGMNHISYVSLGLFLLPFFVLCFFVHPSFVDDYSFVIKTQEYGLINAFMDWYNHWTGRYSLCFIMSINPLIIGSFFLYRVVIFILIGLLPVLSYVLLKTFFVKQKPGFYLSFTALISFFYFYQLPSVNEGLYWMTGAMAYQLPTLCLLMIITILLKIYTNKKKGVLTILFLSFLVIVSIGTNEISMVMLDVFLLVLFAYRTFFQLRRNNVLFAILLLSVGASFFVVLAPGNDVRGSLFPLANDLPQAIAMTIIGFGYYVGQWMGIGCLIAILAFYIIGVKKVELHDRELLIPIPWSLSIFAIVLIAGFFVPAWSTGQMPNPRAINVIFGVFILGFFYHVILVSHRFNVHQKFTGIGNFTSYMVFFGIFFITFYPGKDINNNVKRAYVDLLSGKAYHFDCTMFKLYRTGWIQDFPQEIIPASLGWEITEANFKGDPEKYLKEHYKKSWSTK